MSRSRGVIYAATGQPYLEVARRSALSLRKFNPTLQLCLFSDTPDSSGVFDRTIIIEKAHIRSKVDCIVRTPYDQTLYLDCDTLVRADLSGLFDLLSHFDVAIAQVVLWEQPTHRRRYEVVVPDAFLEPNTGVVLYRSDTLQMQAFLKQWQERFYAFGDSNDQITMRETLWSNPVAYYVLPEQFNKRVFEMSELIYTDRPKARILHLPILRPQRNPIKRWLANRIR